MLKAIRDDNEMVILGEKMYILVEGQKYNHGKEAKLSVLFDGTVKFNWHFYDKVFIDGLEYIKHEVMKAIGQLIENPGPLILDFPLTIKEITDELTAELEMTKRGNNELCCGSRF